MSPSLVARSRVAHLLLLTLAAAAGSYARTAMGPLQETMRLALGLSDNQMALLQGPALALPVVLTAIPLGFLVDRYSRVRLLLVFVLLDLLGSTLTALASSFAILFLARCLVGLGAIAIWIAASSLLADLYAPAARGRATMVVAVGQYAGMAVVFAVGGSLITWTGVGAGPAAWRASLLWLTSPLILVTLSLLWMREPGRTGMTHQKASVLDSLAGLWRYRTLITPLLVSLVMAETAVGAVVIWAAPTLTRNFRLPAGQVGVIMATALMLSGVVGPLAGGALADLCQKHGGPRRAMSALAALVLLIIPAGLFSVAQEVLYASVLLILLMTLVGAIVVMGTTVLTIVIPNELRGICVAVLSAACVLLGAAAAPVMVSGLSVMLGGPDMIGKALTLVCATAGALGTGAVALGLRRVPSAGELRS